MLASTMAGEDELDDTLKHGDEHIVGAPHRLV